MHKMPTKNHKELRQFPVENYGFIKSAVFTLNACPKPVTLTRFKEKKCLPTFGARIY